MSTLFNGESFTLKKGVPIRVPVDAADGGRSAFLLSYPGVATVDGVLFYAQGETSPGTVPTETDFKGWSRSSGAGVCPLTAPGSWWLYWTGTADVTIGVERVAGGTAAERRLDGFVRVANRGGADATNIVKSDTAGTKILSANPARLGYRVYNKSGQDLWIGEGIPTISSAKPAGLIPLPTGSYYESSNGGTFRGDVYLFLPATGTNISGNTWANPCNWSELL